MKKIGISLIIALLLANSSCALLKVKPKVTVQSQTVEKAGWVDGFGAGQAELTAGHYQEIERIVAYLNQHQEATLVLKGSVSTEKIANGTCYVSDDYPRFRLSGKGTKKMRQIKGEQACETELGLARVRNLGAEVIKRGIAAERVTVFTEVDQGQRQGDHSKNRAVSYWYINLPAGAQLISATEQTGGVLLANYQLVSQKKNWSGKGWWQNQNTKAKSLFARNPSAETQKPKEPKKEPKKEPSQDTTFEVE